MDIIRSCENMCKVKNKLKKVKRQRVNWFQVLARLDNSDYFDYFFKLAKKVRRGKQMSSNRCAYNTLKHFYSTTTIKELVRKIDL